MPGSSTNTNTNATSANRTGAPFLAELKRRGVWSALVAYGVVCGGALQLGDVVSHALDLPAWFMKALVALAAVGLPVTGIVSWFFDLTRRGLILTAPPPSRPSPAPGAPAQPQDQAQSQDPALASPAPGSPTPHPAPAGTPEHPTPLTLANGSQLAGRYRIEGELGSGGMGRVLIASDEKLGRRVAVKVLSGSHDPQRLRRFEQEARAAGSLEHPNVLAVYDLGEQGGAPFLVTELLDGRTLREAVLEGPLKPELVREVGLQLGRGLGAAHARGVVHRDLKPENLFLTKDGRLKILDFGLAKLIGEGAPAAGEGLTQTGAVFGTPGYVSPEQARGLPADARSDVFAAGAVLHELLSGTRAFPGATLIEAGAATLTQEPTPLPRGVPPGLSKIIARALEKDPAKRFRDGGELANALETLQAAPAARFEVARAALPKAVSGRTVINAAVIVCVGLLAISLLINRSKRRLLESDRVGSMAGRGRPAVPVPPTPPTAPGAREPAQPPHAEAAEPALPAIPAIPGFPVTPDQTLRTVPGPGGKQLPAPPGVDPREWARTVAEAARTLREVFQKQGDSGGGGGGGDGRSSRITVLVGAQALVREGQLDEAERYLREAISHDPDELYFHLHLGLVLRRRGLHGQASAELKKFAATLDPDEEWIAPLVRFYAGQAKEAAVMEAAADEPDDEGQRTSRLCEAGYYLGVFYATARPPDLARAKQLLTLAAESDARDVERGFAGEELRALGRR